ncbi:hypothetical protein L6452_38784 [Arctium lappa]|uniref:Uncharacterized protein n=1 Tax=Arctium lappa TaxID=4217 RepID=A0ACB8XQY7_ARCLA|nr:hypothetical protein L6452_38784 [Arctium lappa]
MRIASILVIEQRFSSSVLRLTQIQLCATSLSRKENFASPVHQEKSDLRLILLTQSKLCALYSSREVSFNENCKFSLVSAHAKFSSRLSCIAQSTVCVLLFSRKVSFALLTAHANLSLRFLLLERISNGNDMMNILSEGPFEKPKLASGLYKPTKEYSPNELSQYQADRDIKANLMLALPNSIYNRIDCFKTHPNLMWQQLENIMLGSSVATQLRHTRYMNNFEEFKAKDGEPLKTVYDRLCVVINDLRKIKVEKTELETNLKFLNALQPE